ncbi:MAG: hypothetical protein P8011_15505 [Acidihalobacter sp.]|jgi:hypothetical protein|uniref:hypothetical protein n=1 Tax=Acidihalobacter sp. TaxID=1872108 RepID=UPI00307FA94E
MPTAGVVSALLATAGAIVLAGVSAAVSYWFTKQREREAELRKEKLEHYKEFAVGLSGIVSGEGTPEAQRAWALACNKLNLVAPQPVLQALQAFQQESKASNPQHSQERHDELMSALFYEMRRDLGIKPADDKMSFKIGLWASGVPPTDTDQE